MEERKNKNDGRPMESCSAGRGKESEGEQDIVTNKGEGKTYEIEFHENKIKFTAKLELNGKIVCPFCQNNITHIKNHLIKCGNIKDGEALAQFCEEVKQVRRKIVKQKTKQKQFSEDRKEEKRNYVRKWREI